MSPKLRMSPNQSMSMIKFMEKHPEMVIGKPRDPAAVKMLWYYLTKRLNEIGGGGVKKTTAMWMKSWFDKKSNLKRKLLKYGLPKEDDDDSQYSPLEMKTIKLLMQEGEVTQDEIDEGVAKNARLKEMAETEDSFHSYNQLPNQSDDESDTNTEYLDPFLNEDLEDNLEKQSETVTRTKKIRILKREHSPIPANEPDNLQTEFIRVASVEEKRLEAEIKSSKARKSMAESLNRCASAMRALVTAVNHQGAVISEAYQAQGQRILEAQKLQGEMIAKAIANR